LRLSWVVVGIAGGFAGASTAAKLPPLRDPVFLNIGFVCQWQDACMQKQQKAMRQALDYGRKAKPTNWQVQFCNRRATFRRSGRIDWISYYACIRNPKVRGSAGHR
jgi:hypothetical protein